MSTDTPPRVGRRGAILLLAAFCWALTGLQVLTSPGDSGLLLYQRVPLSGRVALWLVPAAVALAAVMIRRIPYGAVFALLFIAPAWRGFSYLWASFSYMVDGDLGQERGWAFAPASIFMVGVILIVLGWPEHRKRDLRKARVDG